MTDLKKAEKVRLLKVGPWDTISKLKEYTAM